MCDSKNSQVNSFITCLTFKRDELKSEKYIFVEPNWEATKMASAWVVQKNRVFQEEEDDYLGEEHYE